MEARLRRPAIGKALCLTSEPLRMWAPLRLLQAKHWQHLLQVFGGPHAAALTAGCCPVHPVSVSACYQAQIVALLTAELCTDCPLAIWQLMARKCALVLAPLVHPHLQADDEAYFDESPIFAVWT